MNHSKQTYDLIDGTTDARWLLLRGSEVSITITLQQGGGNSANYMSRLGRILVVGQTKL